MHYNNKYTGGSVIRYKKRSAIRYKKGSSIRYYHPFFNKFFQKRPSIRYNRKTFRSSFELIIFPDFLSCLTLNNTSLKIFKNFGLISIGTSLKFLHSETKIKHHNS